MTLNDDLLEAVRTSAPVESIQTLLANGADVNYRGRDGWCPVHWASRTGHLELLKFLYKQGADMNKRDRPDAWQPLHVAIKFGHFHVVRFLVETCESNIRSRTRNR